MEEGKRRATPPPGGKRRPPLRRAATNTQTGHLSVKQHKHTPWVVSRATEAAAAAATHDV